MKYSLVLFFYLFSWITVQGQDNKTEIIFSSGKPVFYTGYKNEVSVVTNLDRKKINLECKGCTLTCSNPEKLKFQVIPPTKLTGEVIDLNVTFGGKVVYTQKIKVTVAPVQNPK